MEKRINVELSPNSIEDAIKKLKMLKTSLKELPMEVAKELADEGKNKVQELHDGYRAIFAVEPATASTEAIENGYRVSITGPDVIYKEFGTGDIGRDSNAPQKPTEFGLNDYNTGQTIRDADALSAQHGIKSGKYWTYNGTYLQGIPSGHFVYDTTQYLRKNYKKIAKEKASDVLSKL